MAALVCSVLVLLVAPATPPAIWSAMPEAPAAGTA
jgi:hypothetical protein